MKRSVACDISAVLGFYVALSGKLLRTLRET